MTTSSRLARCALALALVAACTSVASTDLKTAGMTAQLSVVADGTGSSQVSAALHVDTNATDYVQLSPGDTLTAKAGTQSQPMTGSSVLGAVTYAAAFQGADSEGTQYTISLTRTAADVSAPSSTVTMPAPFTLTPPTSTSFSRASNDIVIAYSSSGTADVMAWTLNGQCINALQGTLTGDPGSVTIAHSTLVTPGGNNMAAGNCQLTFTLSRTRSGTIDTAYQGGTFTAAHKRTLNLQSTP